MKLYQRLAATVAAVVLAPAASASAGELLVNGDFSGGDSGFSSTAASGGGGTIQQGGYFVTTSPHAFCSCFPAIGDHTSGSGNMFVADGGTAGDYFWSETVAVVPGQTYALSFWATGVNFDGPTLDVRADVDGATVLDTGAVPQSTGATATTWHNYQTSFSSGASSSLTLRLYDTDQSYYYNDFAIDDVSLTGPSPAGAVPEPSTWAMLILGLGGLGGAARSTRRRASLAA